MVKKNNNDLSRPVNERQKLLNKLKPTSLPTPSFLRSQRGMSNLRDPYPGEREMFQNNPGVAGIATEDRRVALNPYNQHNERQKRSVYELEQIRNYLSQHPEETPQFGLTDPQKQFFERDLQYSQNPQDIRDTIASRIGVGDVSSGGRAGDLGVSEEQVRYSEQLRNKMKRK